MSKKNSNGVNRNHPNAPNRHHPNGPNPSVGMSKGASSTLFFFIGMFMGVILFILAITGTFFAVTSLVSVGDLQDTIGEDFFVDDSTILNKTILEAVQMIIDDVSNMNNITVNTLKTKYGMPIPNELSGVDLTAIFDIPILDIPDNMDLVVNAVSLEEIGSLIGVDFSTYEIPVLQENIDKNIQTAMDLVLSSLDGDAMSIRSVETNFGLSLGDMDLLNSFKDAPFNNIGALSSHVSFSSLLGITSDKFVKTENNAIFAKVDRYEKILSNEFSSIKDGSITFMFDVDDQLNVVYRELRFINKNEGTSNSPNYVVDNTSYAPDFNATTSEKVFYRLIEFEKYVHSSHSVDFELFVPSYKNTFSLQNTIFSPKSNDYISLDDIFYNNMGVVSSVKNMVNSGVFNFSSEMFFKNNEEEVFLSPYSHETLTTIDSVLNECELIDATYFLAFKSDDDVLMQTLSDSTLNNIGNVTSLVMNVKLGDIITITEESPVFLQQLADKTFNEISSDDSVLDSMTIGDFIEIKQGEYFVDDKGKYMAIKDSEGLLDYYTLFNPALADMAFDNHRYSYTPVEGEASSILRRLENVSIIDMSTVFDDLIIGDVMEINVDTMVKIDAYDAENDCFYFEDGLYIKANGEEVNSPDYYKIESSGEDHAIIKKLALLKVTEIGSKMDSVINSLVLGEIIEITMSKYEKNTSGKFVYLESIDGYVLYDAGNPLHTTENRCNLIENNPDTKDSSLLLQRIATMSIADLDNIVSVIYFADVIEIDADIYEAEEAVSGSSKTYYSYSNSNGIYSVVEDIAVVVGNTYFVRVYEGTSNTILKQLAHSQISELDAKMTDIINNLSFAELLDIEEFDKLTANTDMINTDNSRWLVEKNPVAMLPDKDDDFTFILNPTGDYYMSSSQLYPATTSLLKEKGFRTFEYQSFSVTDLVIEDIIAEGNHYYHNSNTNTMDSNLSVTYYLYSQKRFSELFFRQSSLGTVTDITDISTPAPKRIYEEPVYDISNLYVSKGIKYDSGKLISHLGRDLFFLLEDGYFPAEDAQTEGLRYYYDTNTASYVPASSTKLYVEASNTNTLLAQAFIKYTANKVGTESGKYYYVPIDSDYIDTNKYNKVKCATVLYRDDVNGAYIEKIGYVASFEEVYKGNNLAIANTTKTLLDVAKSPSILTYLAKNNVTVENMDSAINNLTISDFIPAEEGSFFSMEEIQSATLETLPLVFVDIFTELTVGEIIMFSGIKTMDVNVLSMLESVKITSFFTSLVFDDTDPANPIKLDIGLLFGIKVVQLEP